MGEFRYFPLRLVPPTFESALTNLIIDLDYLRRKPLFGSTTPFLFFQLKGIFHILESLASARIEGNNTTVAEYIETKISAKPPEDNALKEIENMEKCLAFIDERMENSQIDRAFISDLHKEVVSGLPPQPKGEGDTTPGAYREHDVRIKQSKHIPPPPALVAPYMDELLEFMKEPHEPKYDLIKTAIVHHRFVWIHPFNNGNGRTVRLLTYAMLVKYGFAINKGRILNPAAVFCSQRRDYYDRLALADEGTNENILIWCQYVLDGLKIEIEKIDRLLDYAYLREKILYPTIAYATEREWVTEQEARILKRVVSKDHQFILASDIKDIIESKHSSERSRAIRRLRQANMLVKLKGSARKYHLGFDNNYLLRGIIKSLREEGFVTNE